MQTAELTLEEIAAHVRLVEGEEKEMLLESYHPSVRNEYEKFLIVSDRRYGISLEKGKELEWPSEDAIKAFVLNLEIAANRLKGISDIVSSREGSARFRSVYKTDLPLDECSGFLSMNVKLKKGKLNFTPGNPMMVGFPYIEELDKRAGTERFHPLCINIQSQYFHELLHNYRDDYIKEGKPLDDLSEHITLLGEFLYDPANNPHRNEVFVIQAEEMVRHYKEGKGIHSYASAWVVDSKLLLWEAKQRDSSLEIPTSLDGQLDMVKRLPEIYANTTQQQRDNILAKYMSMPIAEVKEAAAQYAKELNLDF